MSDTYTLGSKFVLEFKSDLSNKLLQDSTRLILYVILRQMKMLYQFILCSQECQLRNANELIPNYRTWNCFILCLQGCKLRTANESILTQDVASDSLIPSFIFWWEMTILGCCRSFWTNYNHFGLVLFFQKTGKLPILHEARALHQLLSK